MGNKQIDYRFKILYAIGTVLIVTAHCQGGLSIFSDWFPTGSFTLAMFMFCSGYFYKTSVEDNVCLYIIKKLKSLLLPLYAYNFVYGIIVELSRVFDFTIGQDMSLSSLFLMPIINGQQFIYNLGGWYVIPLFMIEIYNVLTRKLLSRRKCAVSEQIIFAANLCIGMVGVSLAAAGYNYEWWLVLVRMMFFIPFYSAGYFYRSTLEKHDVIPSIYYFSVVIIVKLAIVFMLGRATSYSPSSCSDFIDGPLMPFISGFLGIAFWLRMARILEPSIGRDKYINLIADNSFAIMIHQFLGFMFVKTIFALLSKLTPLFGDFDWLRYKSDIWYYYLPRNLNEMRILYIISGLVMPIILQFLINKMNGYLTKEKRVKKRIIKN